MSASPPLTGTLIPRHSPDSLAGSELTRILRSFKREFLAVGAFTFVINILQLTPVLYSMQVYDRILISQNEFTLVSLTMITLFLFVIMAMCEWFRSRILTRTGVKLDDQINSRIFVASFEAQLNKGRHNTARAFVDLTYMRQFLTGGGIFAFFDAPWSVIYILVLFMLHPFLGIVALVFTGLQLGLAKLTKKYTYPPTELALDAEQEEGAFLQAKLRNGEVVESLGMLGNLKRRWLERHRKQVECSARAVEVEHLHQGLTRMLRTIQSFAIMAASALLVIEGELTPGAMVAANILLGRALQPLDMAVSAWKQFLINWAGFQRLSKLLDEHPVRPAGQTRGEPRGQISLESFSATAPNRPRPILADLDVAFERGELTAILGPSGSGKSTLARCLLGIWPETSGRVLLDGEPIESWNRMELGPHIGYLPQDIELFEGTIAENIARFSDIDSEKVIAAARKTGIHDMVLRFPKGYDTPIGTGGSFLSGGQRQRVALARAIYGDPSLIVLDEPNANLDSAGEAALVDVLRDLRSQGKSVFLITHRTEIVSEADRILILEDGRIRHYGPGPRAKGAQLPASPAVQPATT